MQVDHYCTIGEEIGSAFDVYLQSDIMKADLHKMKL